MRWTREPRSRTCRRPRTCLGAGDLTDFVGLDDVADLDVVVPGDGDAALVAEGDLTNVVLEAPEARDLTGVDDLAVTQQPRLGVADDLAVGDVASGDNRLRGAERVPDLGGAH